MAFDISSADHARLDQLIAMLLEAYKSGQVKSVSVEWLIGHLIAAAAKDNESEILAWLDPEQQAEWLRKAKNAQGS